MKSAGARFYEAMKEEKPLQLIGVINAYVAMMAKDCGFRALYLSGAGVSNSSYGLPDLGLTTLDNVLTDLHRILSVVDLPILVDIDTGWGNALMIARAIKEMEHAGAAAVHIEDQVFQKRCGHRPGKVLVSQEEMGERIKAAVEAREDKQFVIMARTDAYSVEGLQRTVERAITYKEAGADMLFLEGLTKLEEYQVFKDATHLPILANITEFGQTPLFSLKELATVGVDVALYPLSVNRSMNLAALKVLKELREKGTQKALLKEMQTREELYRFLNYYYYEKKLDEG